MTMMWVAIGTAAAGVAGSVYGAEKNKKAQKKATEANAKNVSDTNALNYQMWLESRGIGPNGQPVNTQLPRFMSWTMPGAQRRVIGYRRAAPSAAPAPLPPATQQYPTPNIPASQPTPGQFASQ